MVLCPSMVHRLLCKAGNAPLASARGARAMVARQLLPTPHQLPYLSAALTLTALQLQLQPVLYMPYFCLPRWVPAVPASNRFWMLMLMQRAGLVLAISEQASEL